MIPDDLKSIFAKFNSACWATEAMIVERAGIGNSQAGIRLTPLGFGRLRMLAQAVTELEIESRLTDVEFAALLLYARKVDSLGDGAGDSR